MKSQFTKQRAVRFLGYYRPHRKIFLMDLFFAALSSVSVLLFPLVSGYLTGEVMSSWKEDSWKKVAAASAVLFLLTAVKTVSNIIYAYFGHAMGARMEETMRTELFRHYESLDFEFHARNSVGKLLTVLSNDLNQMTELFHHAPEDLLMTGIKFIGAFVIMGKIHLPLTLLLFLVLPFLGIFTLYTDRKMEECLLESRRRLADLNECSEDTLSGIRTVKAFGIERQHEQRFCDKNQAYTETKCRFYKLEAFFYETLDSYPQFLTMLVIVIGALLLVREELSASVLVTFLLYAGSLAEPVRTMLNFMRLFEEGKAGFVRFMDMLEKSPSVTEAEDAVTLPEIRGNICLEHVYFRYEGAEEDVLEDLSLSIREGQTVAIAGSSGIGKTTVASLIARFYDVTSGRILIDGTDIRDLSSETLRKNIGIVQQEVYLFNGTIRDNIRCGREDATEEEIHAAAELADIHEFILSLESGYDSLVGTRGILLSGGQRQRISLARLFLKDPKILIMDEATSALDYESEKNIQASLEQLKQGRTCIVIAHRLSTIKNADQIFVLTRRKLAEQGTHEELLARNGLYAQLCTMGQH